MLVRNSDGKIFYIPQAAAEQYFRNIYCTASDDKGNLYAISDNYLIVITIQGDELVLKQVNPEGVSVSGSMVWPMENGTVVVLADERRTEYRFFYPNGGFEDVLLEDEEEVVFLSKTDSGMKAVRLKRRAGTSKEEYVVSLHDYYVGTAPGSRTLSQPIASISSGTDYSDNLGDANYSDWAVKAAANPAMWIASDYETDDLYLLGQCLAVDRRTNRMTGLDWEQSDHVIVPTKDNVYKGLAWEIFANGASWFDIRTLEYGFVDFDMSQVGDFQETGFAANIPDGKATFTGVRYSDGKQVVCIADIETGSVVCSVNESERPVTVLIPLN